MREKKRERGKRILRNEADKDADEDPDNANHTPAARSAVHVPVCRLIGTFSSQRIRREYMEHEIKNTNKRQDGGWW